jgi:hypothetical protein
MAYEADFVMVLLIVLELVPSVHVSVPHRRNLVSITRETGQGVPVGSIIYIVHKTDVAEVLAASKGMLDMIHLARLACVLSRHECLGLFCGLNEHMWRTAHHGK